MTQVNMTAIAVAFLGADVSAQRLAISWPRVAAASSEGAEDDRTARWAQSAGVPVVVAEKGPFDPVRAAVGENDVSRHATEIQIQSIRVASTDHMNPHVHVVVAHRPRQNQIKFFLSDQMKKFGTGLG